jgi:hypothetical protein
VSNIANVVGAVIGLAAINRLLDRTDKVTPAAAPKPLITVTKPTPVVTTPLIKPVMPTQEQITRERFTAPSGTPEQAALISKAYTQGKVIPLGFRQGETTDDLLRRLFRN